MAQWKLDFDGQSVTQDDYNGLGHQAGHAEDFIYAELFRMSPNASAKGILPFGNAAGTSITNATVIAAGATGRVDVNPFRAFIGSRTAVGVDALEWQQDVRSGLSVAQGDTASASQVAIAANASGNPRWDLVYAVLTVDADSSPETRKVKNPGTAVVTDESVSVTSTTSVTVAIVAGTPGASPAFPTIPADSGSIYYIPLAYVRVPNGFNGTSTVANKDINEVAPILAIDRATGGSTLRPANQSNKVGGAAISATGTGGANGVLNWTGAAGTRPGLYMPPSMTGMESRIVAIDLSSGSSTDWSHQHGGIVDDSIDWRKRVFKWFALVDGGTDKFPWNSSGGNKICNGENIIAGPNTTDLGSKKAYQHGFGQSFAQESITALMWAAQFQSLTNGDNYSNVPVALMTTGTFVGLYIDASTGALKVYITGNPTAQFFIWLDATAPYTNA